MEFYQQGPKHFKDDRMTSINYSCFQIFNTYVSNDGDLELLRMGDYTFIYTFIPPWEAGGVNKQDTTKLGSDKITVNYLVVNVWNNLHQFNM